MKKNKITTILVMLTLIITLMIVGSNEVLSENDVYPSKPITLIAPAGPGGTFDIMARIVSSTAGDFFGVPLVVRNLPGASFTLGTEALAKSAPDGYTLEVASPTPFAFAPLTVGTSYDPLNDFEYIANIGTGLMAIGVHKGLPFKTFDELLEHAKEYPGEITVASSGGLVNMWVKILGEMGYKFSIVPFPGAAPAAVAVGGGHVDVNMGSLASCLGLAQSGDIRILCILPNIEGLKSPLEGVPTINEFPEIQKALGVIGKSPYGVYGPKGIPEERLQIIEENLYKAFQSEAFQGMMKRVGIEPLWLGREEYTEDMYEYISIVAKYYEE